jgi:hypothetical protein
MCGDCLVLNELDIIFDDDRGRQADQAVFPKEV